MAKFELKTNVNKKLANWTMINSMVICENLGIKRDNDSLIVYNTEEGIILDWGLFRGNETQFRRKIKEIHGPNNVEYAIKEQLLTALKQAKKILKAA